MDRPFALGLVDAQLMVAEGGRGQKEVCVPKIDVQFRPPSINVIFFPRKN